MTGIYKITCKETGKCYIGQSICIDGRWKDHHKRFPPSKFDYEVLITCDIDYLDFFEKAFIAGYDSHYNGFNKTIGGAGIKCKFPSQETLQKRSESLKGNQNSKGKKYGPQSEEHKRKISEGQIGRKSVWKGKKQPIVTCPHCGKTGGGAPMYRYHFDKCKINFSK